MTDIILEIIRAVLVASIIFLLCWSGRDKDVRALKGWYYIVSGFALILMGMVIDITDNFPGLNQYVIIGDTVYQAFLEKVVGYLVGFLLLVVGFWKWLPMVIALRKTERALKEAHDSLELKVQERTAQLQKSLDEIKTLRGILPLCAFCKKIRNDQGYWQQVDAYIHQHSEADISHSICPDCIKTNYPGFGDAD